MSEFQATQPQRGLPKPRGGSPLIPAPHVVGPNIKFVGTILHAGRVEVYGTVRGRIRAIEISIKQGGRLDGQAEANNIFNDGQLHGHIRARKLLLSKRSLTGGDVRAVEMGMEPGAQFPEFVNVMTPEPRMIPVQTIENISTEIGDGSPPTQPSEASSDVIARATPIEQNADESQRQTPFLVSGPDPLTSPSKTRSLRMKANS